MAISKRHIYSIIVLVIYWPALFILTHIPIPDMVRQAGVSDKFLHFIAYMIFTFVVWSTLSPFEKINWKKWQVWVTAVISLIYGAADEISQQYFDRGTDITDFYADLAGITTVLIIMSFLRFWPGLLTIAAIVMFILPNFSSGNMLLKSPLLNTLFHFGGFAFFTMVWIHTIDRYLPLKDANIKWLIISFAVPALFLAIVKLATQYMAHKPVWLIDYITALIGIVLVIFISAPTAVFRHRITRRRYDNGIYKY